MSTKFAFVSTLGLVMLLNGFSAGAVTYSLAKDTKKQDKKPVVASVADTSQRSVEKKKDDQKKEELVTSLQPALMKPASWRSLQQQRHYNHHRTTIG